MAFDYCPRCGRMMFSEKHVCPPEWYVWIDGDGGNWDLKVFASDAAQAAEEFVAKWDAASEYIVAEGDEELNVAVERMGSDKCMERFTVTGEMVPKYRVERR